MASRQGAVKHGFVSKIAGGCSSYDVIAPGPDLTWSIFFLPKVAQGLSYKGPQNPAARSAAVFFAIYEKPQGGGGGGAPTPPVRARVKRAPYEIAVLEVWAYECREKQWKGDLIYQSE